MCNVLQFWFTENVLTFAGIIYSLKVFSIIPTFWTGKTDPQYDAE